ncbi:cation transporter [Luethyella okanaganae]|uniref:cation transporter n=1 Tax=Luethyella okanaganae TaxID=69372 RepID=UPI0036D7A5DC
MLTTERRTQLHRRVRWIVSITIAYNLIEAVVAIAAGGAASSSALIGFGLDSLIEVASAVAVAWQFSRTDPERYEQATLRAISLAFFALAAYLAANAALTLSGALTPEHSPIGIALTALSVVIMPLLSWFERHTGRELGSATVVADSKQTLLCGYLSVAVLLGLLLNSLFGWAFADAVAALVIAVFAVREGVEAWRGDSCATPAGILLEDDEREHAHHGQH